MEISKHKQVKVSVVVCTYHPKKEIVNQVIASLKDQHWDRENWELIIIDNNSPVPVGDIVNVNWHTNARIIIEPKPGLSHARMAGVRNSTADLIVFVDDDNLLAPDYLEKAWFFSVSNSQVGCFGGRSLPVFETTPPSWFTETGINLGCQDFGSEGYVSTYASNGFQISGYPEKAPIGTGMVILKKAFEVYVNEAATDLTRMSLGRRGKSLSSGEDNDIILTIVKKGFEIAYVPELVVHHMIPAGRYSKGYLQRMAFESNRTWVKVLQMHGINPWKKISKLSYGPRKVRSFFKCKPWQSPLFSIRWKSACGIFKGLTEI